MFAPPLASKTTNEQTGGGKLSAAGALVAVARVAAHQLGKTRGDGRKKSFADYNEIFESVQLGFPIDPIGVICLFLRHEAPKSKQRAPGSSQCALCFQCGFSDDLAGFGRPRMAMYPHHA
ncbi:hypothetical protein SAMN05414139_03155 [Burkholderia sp. D7]|nr:hypothetical protein SAMN05414139_03155 [Burkholderia sp. D7]